MAKNGYQNRFTLADFFMSEKMKDCFPQFSNTEASMNMPEIPEKVVKKVAEYYARFLGGKLVGTDINVDGNKKEIVEKVRSQKDHVESIFNNIDCIHKNLKNKTKLYLTTGNLDLVANNADIRDKVMSEILENLRYREAFGTQNERRKVELSYLSDKNISKSDFKRMEAQWQLKVGVK